MRTVVVECPECMGCGKSEEIELPKAEVDAWQRGALIQSVWPDMSADQRELLKTGTHPKCWDELMGPEE